MPVFSIYRAPNLYVILRYWEISGEKHEIIRKEDAMYMQIMIIDSDLVAAKELKYYLQTDTMRSYYTTSVTEGIRHLAHYCFHLVVINVSSVESDGLQTFKRVRTLVSIPILALSVNGSSSHIVQILTIADDFLQKPIDLDVCAGDNKLLIDPGRRKVILLKLAAGLQITTYSLQVCYILPLYNPLCGKK